MRGEGRAAAVAVGHHLVPLVQQPLVADRLQRPPHRLDIALIKGSVGVLQVHPEADAFGQPVPLLEELEHGVAALFVELLDPVLLDLGLALDPELLFNRDLHGQPVAVPATLALHAIAAHRLVARIDVLEHAREHVVRAGPAVGRGGPLVEHPLLGSVAVTQRLAEYVALAPALQHFLLELGQLLAGVHLARRYQSIFSGGHWAAHCRWGVPVSHLPTTGSKPGTSISNLTRTRRLCVVDAIPTYNL